MCSCEQTLHYKFIINRYTTHLLVLTDIVYLDAGL